METATLRDFLQNPPGAYSRQVAARYAIIEDLKRRYREAVADPALRKRFKARVVQTQPARFLVWVKVPSTKYKVDYDVIVELTFPEGVRAVASAQTRIYANVMSWAFVYGFVATTQGFLIPGWERALGRAAREAPTVTNPSQVNGFDRVVTHALYFITGAAGLLTRQDLERVRGGPADAPQPSDPALSVEAKLFEYQRASTAAAEANRREKAAAKRREEMALKTEKQAAERAAANRSQSARSTPASKRVGAAKSVKSANQRKSR